MKKPEDDGFQLIDPDNRSSDTHPSVNYNAATGVTRLVTTPGTTGDTPSLIFSKTIPPATFRRDKNITIDVTVSVSGEGYAGFELTFADGAVLVDIFENSVEISCPGGLNAFLFSAATPPNSLPIPWQLSYDLSGAVASVFRDSSLITDPFTVPFEPAKKIPRILFWAEQGGEVAFHNIGVS